MPALCIVDVTARSVCDGAGAAYDERRKNYSEAGETYRAVSCARI